MQEQKEKTPGIRVKRRTIVDAVCPKPSSGKEGLGDEAQERLRVHRRRQKSKGNSVRGKQAHQADREKRIETLQTTEGDAI